MDNKFSQNIIKQIENRNLKPKPRWRFLLKNQTFWALAIMAMILGGLSGATIIFILTDTDWDVFRYLGQSWLGHIVFSLPYFWLITLGILMFVAWYNFKNTERGHRHRMSRVMIVSLLGSLFISGTLFAFGFNCQLHHLLMRQLPPYNKIIYTKEDIWVYPEQGLLSGFVKDINDKSSFTLTDCQGWNWHILVNENTFFEKGVKMETGEHVKIIGNKQGQLIFKADTLRPWGK